MDKWRKWNLDRKMERRSEKTLIKLKKIEGEKPKGIGIKGHRERKR